MAATTDADRLDIRAQRMAIAAADGMRSPLLERHHATEFRFHFEGYA
jgi:hypothetical protein